MLRTVRNSLIYLICLVDSILSSFYPWRAARGGHWERWYTGTNQYGELVFQWFRVKECSDHTGEQPHTFCYGHALRCQQGVYQIPEDVRLWCECNRDLRGAEGVYFTDDGVDITYSCPCGEWSRWSFATDPPQYVGSDRLDTDGDSDDV